VAQENKLSVTEVVPGKGIAKNVDNLAHNLEGTSQKRSLNDFDENLTPRTEREIAECARIRARLIEIAATTEGMAKAGSAHHENPNYAAIEAERVKLNQRLAELNT
jgi:hypothetical protein